MINELNQLAEAMENAQIDAEIPHGRYNTLPAITAKAPCVRIVLKDGRVAAIEGVSRDMGKELRKYGDNQGSFPAMNLAPLYRIEDKSVADALTLLLKNHGEGAEPEVIRSWCVSDNWRKKFANKYRVSMEERSRELKELLGGEAASDCRQTPRRGEKASQSSPKANKFKP